MKEFNCDKGIITRSIISFLLLGFILVNTFFEVGVTQEQPNGIEDKLHNQLKSLNNFFKENEDFRNILLIINNIILDLSIIFLIIIWLSFVKNLKIFISLGIFFTIKIFIELVFLVRPPNDNLIIYPGFPSVFYSYNKNDFFFFSGTVGFYIIMLNEFFENRNNIKLSFFFLCVNLFNLFLFIFISLSIYSLYTIDVLIGIVTSHYSIRLSRYVNEYNLSKGYFYDLEIKEKDFFEELFSFLKISDKEEQIKQSDIITNENPIDNNCNKDNDNEKVIDNSIYTQ